MSRARYLIITETAIGFVHAYSPMVDGVAVSLFTLACLLHQKYEATLARSSWASAQRTTYLSYRPRKIFGSRGGSLSLGRRSVARLSRWPRAQFF
eukprot:6201603-Pleurochrysis_carterae.AAC.2